MVEDADRPAADDVAASTADQPVSETVAAAPEEEAAAMAIEAAGSPDDAGDGARPVIQIEAPTPPDAQSEAALSSDSPIAATASAPEPAPASAPAPASGALPALSIDTTAAVPFADGNAATAEMLSSQGESFQPPPFLAVSSPVPPAGSGSAVTSPVRATEPSLAYLGTRLSSAGPTVLPHQVRRSRQEPASPAAVILPEPAPRLTLADRIAAAIRSLAVAAAGSTPEREQVVPSRLGPWSGATEADSGRTTPPRLRRRRRGPPGEADAAGRTRQRGQDSGDGGEQEDEYSDTDEYDEGEEEELSEDEVDDEHAAADDAAAAEQQEQQQETGIIAEILNWWRGSAVPPPGPQRPRRARSIATAEPSVIEAADEPDPSAYDPRMHYHRQSAGRMHARNAGEPFGPLATAMPDDDGYRLAGSRWTIEPTARAFARAGGPLDPDALGEPAYASEHDARRARAPASRVVPSAGAGPDVPDTLDEPELFASLATHAHRRAAGRATGTAGDGFDDPSALEDPGHLGEATVHRDRRAAGRVAAAAGVAAASTMDEPELLAAQQYAARARATATAEPFSALSALQPPGEDGVAAGAFGRGGRARAMAGATVYDAPRDPYSDAEPAYDGASNGTVEEALAGSGSSASGAGDADDEATSTAMSTSTARASRRRVSRASQGLWPAILGAAPWWLGGSPPPEEDELDEHGRIPIEAQYQGPIDLRQTFMFAPFKHWRRLYCVIVDDGLELCKSYKDTRLLAYLPLVQSCICYEDVEDADDATPRRVVELHLASGDMYTFRCPNEQEAADLIAAVRKRTAMLNLEVVPYLYLTMPMPVGFTGQPLKFGWVRARIDASNEWLWRTFTLTDFMLCIGLSAPADSEELLDCALKCFNAELRAREQLPSDLDIAPADRPRTFALRTSRGVFYVRAELRSEMLEWLNAIKFASVMAVIRQNEFCYRCDWNHGEHRREVRLLLRRTSGVHLLSADGRTELRHYYFKNFLRCRLFGDLIQLDFGQPDDDILELRTAEPAAISIVLNTMLDLAGRTVNQTQNGSLWHPGRDRMRSKTAKSPVPAIQAH